MDRDGESCCATPTPASALPFSVESLMSDRRMRDKDFWRSSDRSTSRSPQGAPPALVQTPPMVSGAATGVASAEGPAVSAKTPGPVEQVDKLSWSVHGPYGSPPREYPLSRWKFSVTFCGNDECYVMGFNWC